MRPLPLFVYGSLLAPQVLQALLDREPPLTAARLSGFRRSTLRGHDFPGIVAHPGAVTAGGVIHLSGRELQCLDAWEGDYFVRRAVRVELGDGTEAPAHVYLLAPAHRSLLSARPWHPQAFIERLAPASTDRARRWRRDRDLGLRHTSRHSPQP